MADNIERTKKGVMIFSILKSQIYKEDFLFIDISQVIPYIITVTGKFFIFSLCSSAKSLCLFVKLIRTILLFLNLKFSICLEIRY